MIILSASNVDMSQSLLMNDIERIQEQVAEELGFKIIDHSLYITADCMKKPCSCRLGGKENIDKCHKEN